VIKINLLAVDRDRSKRKAKFQIGQKITAVCSLVLVVAALGVGWWFWYLQRASTELDEQIAAAQRETQRLQSIIRQVQQFEARRAQLQQRVTLIEQLRKGQTGPVHLLDHVSRALPDSMWLTDLKNTGADVAIDGRCMSLNSLSDFISGLEGSKLFVGSVEIVDSRVELATTTTPELIRFSVKGKLLAGAAN
jgi:type IV pilus assembly protein PilN